MKTICWQDVSVFLFLIFSQWDKIIHNFLRRWMKILTTKKLVQVIWFLNLVYCTNTHCFSLFTIRYKIQSGHFLSLFINISGSQVELTGLKNPLSRAKKNTVLFFPWTFLQLISSHVGMFLQTAAILVSLRAV